MFLTGLVIVLNAIGGILLFLWGSYFFSSTMAVIFGGFSALQAVTAGVAFLGLCNVRFLARKKMNQRSWERKKSNTIFIVASRTYLVVLYAYKDVCIRPVARGVLGHCQDWHDGVSARKE